MAKQKLRDPEAEFRDRFASDQAGAVWEALMDLHRRISILEAKMFEYHPLEEKLDLLLGVLSRERCAQREK